MKTEICTTERLKLFPEKWCINIRQITKKKELSTISIMTPYQLCISNPCSFLSKAQILSRSKLHVVSNYQSLYSVFYEGLQWIRDRHLNNFSPVRPHKICLPSLSDRHNEIFRSRNSKLWWVSCRIHNIFNIIL